MEERDLALSELAETLGGISRQLVIAADAIDHMVEAEPQSVDEATFLRQGRKELAALIREVEGPRPRQGGRD